MGFQVKSTRSMTAKMKSWATEAQKLAEQNGLRSTDEYLVRHRIPGWPNTWWPFIVDFYSSMALTVDTDRPVAIAGVIDIFRPFLGEYWAGMWQKLTTAQLNWQTNEHNTEYIVPHCTRPSEKRAPSWSWMSLEGRVDFGRTL